MMECNNCIEWKKQLESERQLREQMKFDNETLKAKVERLSEQLAKVRAWRKRYYFANTSIGGRWRDLGVILDTPSETKDV